MKKFKCFLMLSLIVILAVGVFTGCSVQAGVDPEVTPHKITYCSNGGNLGIDAENVIVERYFYVQDGVHAFEPHQDSNMITPATSADYKFLGWAKGKTDANGNPVFRDEPIDRADGGVLVSPEDGPISPTQAGGTDGAVRKYYDYYDVATEGFWDFSRDIVTENIVLVAIWEEYNKYIVAEKNEQGEWNDYNDLLTGNLAVDKDLAEKYNGKLRNVVLQNGTVINEINAKGAYDEVKKAGHTLIGYYVDPECTEEFGWPYTVEDSITIIYPLEVEGDYARVDSLKTLQDAINKDKNIYMVKDVDAAGASVSFSGTTYTGIIKGNGHKINVVSTVTQTVCEDEENYYGGFFGILDGAEIHDLTFNVHLVFAIAINPSVDAVVNGGSVIDALCYVGVFAESMNNCKLNKVVVNVEYETVHAKNVFVGNQYVDGHYQDVYEANDYEVEVEFIEEWSALEGEGNVIGEDCELSAVEYEAESSDEPADEGADE